MKCVDLFLLSLNEDIGVLTRQIQHRRFLIDTVLYTPVFKSACLKGKCLQWENAIRFASEGLCAFKVNFFNI